MTNRSAVLELEGSFKMRDLEAQRDLLTALDGLTKTGEVSASPK